MDNTLLIYCSDHGDLLGEHRLFNKAATFYEGETRIPMIIRFPKAKYAGKQISYFASSVDFVPTLFDILNMDPDISLPGHSLLPMIEKGEKIREHVTCATAAGMMIRTEKYKLEQIEGTIAYLDSVGTRAESRTYKRMRLILTSAYRRPHNRMHNLGRYHKHSHATDHKEHR